MNRRLLLTAVLVGGVFALAARCYENAYRYDAARPAYRAWFLDAAIRCGNKPVTEALAQALAQRMRPAVVRRDPMAMPLPSEMAAAVAAYDLLGVSPRRIGQWRQPQPMAPGMAQPPSSHTPTPPEAGMAQPGVPNPYQPYQPAAPERPPG